MKSWQVTNHAHNRPRPQPDVMMTYMCYFPVTVGLLFLIFKIKAIDRSNISTISQMQNAMQFKIENNR